MTPLTLNRCLMLTSAGLAMATAGPASAQQMSVIDLSVSAKQSGRVVASTRTGGDGGFRFDLAPGTYDICVGPPPAPGAGIGAEYDLGGAELGDGAARQSLPDHRPRVPGAGGRAGGQALASGGAAGCFPLTVTSPGGAGTTRSEPIRVPVRQADGTVVYALAGMRTNPAADGSGASAGPQAYSGGFADLAVSEAISTGASSEGRGGRRVDPRIPPPGDLRVSADVSTLRASSQTVTVTVVGTLSLER